jgi:tetratricopeptide (TPR) repeat protein
MANPSFRERLKRARLPRILVVYLAASWLVIEVTSTLQDVLSLPEWTAAVSFVLLLSGLVVIVATAWVQANPGLDEREASGEVPDGWNVGVADLGRSLRQGRLPHLTWGRAVVGGVVVFSLLFGFTGMYVLMRGGGRAPTGATPLAAEGAAAPGVVVVPFSVSAPELELWGEGMVDLLSTNLDGLGGVRGIDSRTVLARWSESVADGVRPDLAGMLRVAREAGGRWAVLGSLVGTADQIRVTADVYEVESGTKVGTTRAEGAADAIMEVVDALSAQVVPLLLGEDAGQRVQHLSALTTSSLPAMEAFLEGERHYRENRFSEAEERFRTAVQADSLFALAWLRLRDAYGWTGVGGADYNESAEVSYRRRDRLPVRDAILVEAQRALTVGSMDHLESLREATRRYPDDPGLWLELGEHYVHFGGQAADAADSAVAALERAIELDPSFGPYYIHAVDFAILAGDSARAARLLEGQKRASPASDYHTASSLAFDLVFGNEATVERAWRDVETGDPRVVDWGFIALFSPRTVHARARLLRSVYDRAGVRGEILVHTLADLGLLREASELSRRDEVGDHVVDEILMALRAAGLSVPAGYARPEEPDGDVGAAVLLARGVDAVAGDPARLSDVRMEMARRAGEAGAAGDSLNARRWSALEGALRGYAAWRVDGDRETAARELEAARPHISGWYPGQSWQWAAPAAAVRWWLGELRAEAGDAEEAAYLFRTMLAPPLLAVLSRYRLGEMYERLGRTEDARREYGTFVEAWSGADPELRPLVDDARRRLDALTAEGE